MRIGHGYDVHRLVPGRKLILGGVEIPHHLGLLGHSDADVAAHALCDALLGAAALGDIGQHFPDTDPAYAGADSLVLLGRVVELLRAERDALLALLDSALRSTSYDQVIAGIVHEEAGAFFAGQRSAEEVSQRIQSRVLLYMSEQG